MYAVFESGGKQYRVTEGDVVFLERLAAEPGSVVIFDKVLACSNESESDFGKPYMADTSVEAKVIGHGKDKKIIVYKYKAKKGYRKKQGHRQPYTRVRIERIVSEKLGIAEYAGEPDILAPHMEAADIEIPDISSMDVEAVDVTFVEAGAVDAEAGDMDAESGDTDIDIGNADAENGTADTVLEPEGNDEYTAGVEGVEDGEDSESDV